MLFVLLMIRSGLRASRGDELAWNELDAQQAQC